MKKFIYVAIMAVVMGMFVGCKSNANGSDYYQDGKVVVVDEAKGTVNGVKYDNTTEKCWAWTMKETSQGTTIEHTYYVWSTEFELVAACEMEMFECSRSGRVASYAYIQWPSLKTEDACMNANN